MFINSQVKLVDELARDTHGKPTGQVRGKPTYLVMIDPAEMAPALEQYRHVPAHIDDCWAGQQTVYLRFTTEAECRAKMAKYLA